MTGNYAKMDEGMKLDCISHMSTTTQTTTLSDDFFFSPYSYNLVPFYHGNTMIWNIRVQQYPYNFSAALILKIFFQ